MLALLLSCMAVAAQAAPCVAACDGKHTPVCGSDGFTYQSACVAECQGITVAASGPCPKAQGGYLKQHGKPIAQADMDRFKGEGFRLIGSAKAMVFDPALGADALSRDAEKNRGKDAKAPAATDAELTTLRYTSDGLVFARKMPTNLVVAALSGLADPQPPTKPLESDNAPLSEDEETHTTAADRKLLQIFGSDDRVRVGNQVYPWTAGGRVTFAVAGSGYACSGAMISSRTVLTAGHCVFDRFKQAWASNVAFTPMQTSSTSKPYGTFAAQYLQTFSGWADPAATRYWPYDFGAIQLKDTTVGSRTGYFGLQIPGGIYTQTLYTAGYPGDKPTDGQIYHYCDQVGGQSGSPMYTSANYIVGVISWESLIKGNSNGAAELRSEVWTSVLGWR